jgi:hypothetical protein
VPDSRDAWAEVAAARVPAVGLAALAAVRCRPGVGVVLVGKSAWATFPAGDGEVIRCLMPVPGVEFFARRGGAWARFGHRLPTADAPPAVGMTPSDRVVLPEPVEPIATATVGPPVRLTIVRGGGPRPATALRCAVAALARWADVAPARDLAAVRAARTGDRALLLGERLPAVPGERFWGEWVLVPLGFRAEPALPNDVLRAACGVGAEELLLLDGHGAEAVPVAAFEPLTRAGVRLANRE